jgi:predicted DNA-binding transcriptional regulator YafY
LTPAKHGAPIAILRRTQYTTQSSFDFLSAQFNTNLNPLFFGKSMSYSKAIDLLRLADFAAARHRGVTLQEIEDEFQVARRTAQRMTNALEQAFPIAVEILRDPDRTKRWTLREAPLARLKMHGDEELEALDYSIERLSENGDLRQRNALAALRDRLMAALPTQDARRLEADAEWMLEAYGVAARPGPATQISKEISETISDAIRSP